MVKILIIGEVAHQGILQASQGIKASQSSLTMVLGEALAAEIVKSVLIDVNLKIIHLKFNCFNLIRLHLDYFQFPTII